MIVLCFSCTARASTASTPTATALACSMKPARLRSVCSGTGNRTAAAQSNDEKWIAGMSSAEKKARIT